MYVCTYVQAQNILSKIQELKDLIDQSESIILINLDSQRNVMMKLSLQLEMGMFSATVCGLVGVAFGMNLNSALEEVSYGLYVVLMVTDCFLEPICVLVGHWIHDVHFRVTMATFTEISWEACQIIPQSMFFF